MSASSYHVPVLTDAVVALLAAAPPGTLVDATLGGGGHTEALLRATGGDRPLIGVDQDPDALAHAESRLGPAPVSFSRGNFRDLPTLLARALGPEARVAGILADLGVSSWQLDRPERGFGIRHAGAALDMRMDAEDDARPTALELLRALDVPALARVLSAYGEVPRAFSVARHVKAAVDAGRVATTDDLAREVEAVRRPGRRKATHPATQVFQALRLAVNRELEALDALLDAAPDLLCDGGRLVVISYHSLEDRRVKRAFAEGQHGPPRPGHLPPPSDWRPTWQILTKKPITASADEVGGNPRARSARLRAAARAPLETTGQEGGR